MTDYAVSYSRRRTLALYVHEDGQVEVRAPRGLSKKRIQEFVTEKTGWIQKRRMELQSRDEARRDFRLARLQEISLLGKRYSIRREGGPPGIRGTELFLPGDGEEELRGSLEAAVAALARSAIPPRVEELAGQWGFSCAGITITGARTRWGSCSGQNRLSFSRRLCYGGREELDYVILHELCHTVQHNHSPRFWRLVEERMPDWRVCRERLKELQRRLEIQSL